MATSQDFVNWVCGDGISSRYLHYILLSEQDSVRRFAHGTTHQTVYYPEAKAFHVCIPRRSEQEAIVGVLGALDDKIAVNERVVTTTQNLMQVHYLRAIGLGSVTAELGSLVEFHNRKRVPLSSRQRSEVPGPYPYYGAAGVVDHVRDFIFDGPHVLVGEDGTVITGGRKPVTQYVWGRFWVNNHAHVLTGRTITTELLAVALQFTDVSSLVTGAVQPKVSMRNLSRLEVVVPTAESAGKVETAVSDLTALVRRRSAESRTLAALRDTLLPQLMSGKLRVRDAERIVEDAV
jgi:type I restriction enzyme S subunit